MKWHRAVVYESVQGCGVQGRGLFSHLLRPFSDTNFTRLDPFIFNVLAATRYSRLQRAGCHTIQPSSTCWLPHGTAVFNVLAATRYSRLQRAGCHTIQPKLTGNLRVAFKISPPCSSLGGST